ncbi:protein translocase subunit SecF [Patescibacteria group bacterium]|nr:MAG: protein translocase subunit SecF [Patescibacteria group bacterium]
MKFNVIATRKIWYALSAVMVAASIGAIALWGLKLGIDFTGGALLQVRFAARPAVQEIERRATEAGVGTVHVQPVGDNEAILRLQATDDASRQKVLTALGAGDDASVTQQSYETVGPSVGSELRSRSIRGMLLVLAAIVAYIAFAFRSVSKPVSSWKYGIVAIIALLHDVIIPTGVFAALGHFAGVEIDVLFVTAVLTVLGFSVHDTIVVFDRIRENLRRRAGQPFEDVVAESVRETFVRSLNTSLTVFLVLLAVYLFGGVSTRNFILALLIGIVAGTYSSIFIASPLLVTWQKLSSRR